MELGFEPGAAGWEARMLPLCLPLPHHSAKLFSLQTEARALPRIKRESGIGLESLGLKVRFLLNLGRLELGKALTNLKF